MRLIHRRNPSPHGESGAQAGLGAVRVDDPGPDRTDQPGEFPRLTDDGRTGVTAGPPVMGLGALGADGGGQPGAGRAGDRDPQAGGALGADQVDDDTGDPAVAGLDHVQDGDGPGVRIEW